MEQIKLVISLNKRFSFSVDQTIYPAEYYGFLQEVHRGADTNCCSTGVRIVFLEMNESKMIDIFNALTGDVESVPSVFLLDDEWADRLTSEQYNIMRLKGTEPPFAGKCDLPEGGKTGVYSCVGCGTHLFAYDFKYDSGSGWPSFLRPVSDMNIRYASDPSHGMNRIDVSCARCGSHLGHMFDDGPLPTGKRYCINAAVLEFKPAERVFVTDTAIFAAGCFWGVESRFRRYLGKGIVSTRVGYTGGSVPNPTYEQVCSHTTGHYESVELFYNPDMITYNDLLRIFWSIHNPLRSNGQGFDVGPQYQAAIFYLDDDQRKAAERSKLELQESGKLGGEIKTLILPATLFYPAEEYHQRYFEKRGVDPSCTVL